MQILILETQNEVGEALKLLKDTDAEKYELLKGQYYGKQGRWEVKGNYDDLETALGVYCFNVPRLVKEELIKS